METVLIEWVSLAIRWIHIITGIAWIGASFYFNWLLNHLLTSDDPKVSGQLWALHAGGFFNVEKRNIEPGKLPAPLHWFKWESYWTWISGFSMMVVVYYFGAEAYLIDPSVADLLPGQAIAISLMTLFFGWIFYHELWSSRIAKANGKLALVITALFVILVAYGLTHVFSGRGAFLHVGAMLATWMTGNVFFVIMPGQRKLVESTKAGLPQDKSLAEDAGWRSLHNNYITLPVLFCMFSNHYPSTFGGEWSWLVLTGLFVVGIIVRHYFNIREKQGNLQALWMLIIAFILFILVAMLASYPQLKAASGDHAPLTYAQIKPILDQRCVSCHAAQPTSTMFSTAPKGVMLETEEQVRSHAAMAAVQVASKAMPLGNMTKMTDEERQVLLQWINQNGKR